MADAENDRRTIRIVEPARDPLGPGAALQPADQPAELREPKPAPAAECSRDGLQAEPAAESPPSGFGDLADLSNTTILYVQPDGSLVEGSGLTAEEQQAVLTQLSKQQVVQVSDTEAAQLLHQSQLLKPVQNTALDPSQLQQVINQVTRTHSQVQVSLPNQNNASHQLKSVAQQVAMQSGCSVQTEPVRIPIQARSGAAPQQKVVGSNPQQAKLPASNSAQIIHIQPVVSQTGQQFFLQQNPGDPPIQLLLQSPAPVVGSLLPLVQKLTGASPVLSQKPAAPAIRVTPASVVKAPPSTSISTMSLPLVKPPHNGAMTSACKALNKPATTPAAGPVQIAAQAAEKPDVLAMPTVRKERDKEKEKKIKKKEKKAAKVQTRSGRVSRPPKYKAKDYKFIKTEDLADGHQSDSDDYSDMSVEDEDGEGSRRNGSGPNSGLALSYSHKSRSHHCQTCDKAYIGPGGLNRHYKLNPTHGEPDLNTSTPVPPNEENQLEERKQEEEEVEDTPAAMETSRADGDPVSAVGLRGIHHRGPGRPRGRGRGRGRPMGLPPKVAVSLMSKRGRRGRPPKLGISVTTAEQQVERRRERLQELAERCDDEELMDIVLPRLTKVLSLWELLLAKVERRSPAPSRFPAIYQEFETLQAQVRQAAQEYITCPQGGNAPLEVRNIEVARSLGILDEVNKMKVVPGASPSSSVTNKNVRYLGNSKMLPPSKRFKMENSIPVQQNGTDRAETGSTTITSIPPLNCPLKTCSVSVSPLVLSTGSKLLSSSFSSSVPSSQPPHPAYPVEVGPDDGSEGADLVLTSSEITSRVTELETMLCSSSDASTETKTSTTAESGSTKTADSEFPKTSKSGFAQTSEPALIQNVTEHQQTEFPSQTQCEAKELCESKELQEGQEIYIQTDGLTVQLAEPGSDGIVIVNGPDGTTMHIQTPEGIPLEAVQALLGIEASDGAKAPH